MVVLKDVNTMSLYLYYLLYYLFVDYNNHLVIVMDLDYMYNNLPILFMGNTSYLNDSSSPGLIEVELNNRHSFEKSLNFINNLSKEELNMLGIENYKIVEKLNNPKLLYKLYERIINE